MMDFFDEHPIIATSVIGIIFTIICCITPLRSITGVLFIGALLLSRVYFVYMLIINILAFAAVSKEKIKTGMVLSVLGGFLGGIIASKFVQPDSKAVKIILTACVWLFTCTAISGYIFLENDFRLFP